MKILSDTEFLKSAIKIWMICTVVFTGFPYLMIYVIGNDPGVTFVSVFYVYMGCIVAALIGIAEILVVIARKICREDKNETS